MILRLPPHEFHTDSCKSTSADLTRFVKQTNSARKVFIHRVAPTHNKAGEKLVDSITNEHSDHWSALKPSNKWSRYVIRTFVGVAGFGIVWLCLLNQ